MSKSIKLNAILYCHNVPLEAGEGLLEFSTEREETSCSWKLVWVKEKPLEEKVFRIYFKLVKCEYGAAWITNSMYKINRRYVYQAQGKLFDQPVKVEAGKSVRSPMCWKWNDYFGKNSNYQISFSFDVEHALPLDCIVENGRPSSKLRNFMSEYKAKQTTALVGFMKSVMCNDGSADVTLLAESQSFPAHKIILRGRSAVFAAMFDSGMEESRTGIVKIQGFGADVVKAMLEYVYTGGIETAAEQPLEVLKIADQYQLLELRDACEKIIVSTLSPTSATEALKLADQLKLGMKSEVICYMNRNRKYFLSDGSFRKFAQEYSHLLLELYGDEHSLKSVYSENSE